jgi:hypothetical protein
MPERRDLRDSIRFFEQRGRFRSGKAARERRLLQRLLEGGNDSLSKEDHRALPAWLLLTIYPKPAQNSETGVGQVFSDCE